jgi:uncharacterized membrane protein YqhA
MLIAVFGSFAASVTLWIYGALETVITISHTATVPISRENSKQLILSCIEVVDLFLLATVFYITALGLYELFIDDRIKVSIWLEIHTIDDLTTKLTSAILVLLSVLFFAEVAPVERRDEHPSLSRGYRCSNRCADVFSKFAVKKPKSD